MDPCSYFFPAGWDTNRPYYYPLYLYANNEETTTANNEEKSHVSPLNLTFLYLSYKYHITLKEFGSNKTPKSNVNYA